ncbi:hypothetical protein DH2020_014759 [Rehmannia glutinosa]|uniref:RNA-binding S4 domain-containing protein n=1 Tax=Rehmannia glutinosa TaxID=99300 RepID=A0ABR0WY99_REHGL
MISRCLCCCCCWGSASPARRWLLGPECGGRSTPRRRKRQNRHCRDRISSSSSSSRRSSYVEVNCVAGYVAPPSASVVFDISETMNRVITHGNLDLPQYSIHKKRTYFRIALKMLSPQSLSWHSVKPLSISLRNPSLQKLISTARAYSTSISAANFDSDDFQNPVSGRPNNFSGFKIEETVELDSRKLRLDSWLSSRINGISRARVQSSIRSGLVSVNGHIINKVSHVVRDGDVVNCKIAELQPLRAEPEDIPLDIVYEDEHVLVVNKPAHMVVHPAPGNATGTLVNGILNHCRLSTVFLSPEALPETDDDSGDEASAFSVDQGHTVDIGFGFSEASVRPGIVHRLDKGTSGLLVVAKDEHSHSHLAEQFKKHTIKRVYVSLTCGVPSPLSGRIDVPEQGVIQATEFV